MTMTLGVLIIFMNIIINNSQVGGCVDYRCDGNDDGDMLQHYY